MRTAAFALLLALVGVVATEPALAHPGRARVSVGVGFGFGPYWGPYWGPGWWYPPPYYYYPPPAVVAAPPVTYIEQGSAPSADTGNWWYYCESTRGYYPYVKECPAGWQRVSPVPPNAK